MTRSLQKGAGLAIGLFGAVLMFSEFAGGGPASAHHFRNRVHHSTTPVSSPSTHIDASAKSGPTSDTPVPPVSGVGSSGPDLKNQQTSSPDGSKSIWLGKEEGRESDRNGDAIKGPMPEGKDAVTRPTNPTGWHTLDNGPVDTRVTVLPRQNDAEYHRRSRSKTSVTSISPRNMLQRHEGPGAGASNIRNSLGESVPQQNGPSVRRSSVPPASEHVVSGNAGTVGAAHDDHGMTQPKIVSSITPIALSHGLINGTNFIRPGIGLTSIGGPVKMIVGVNGSAIHPKH